MVKQKSLQELFGSELRKGLREVKKVKMVDSIATQQIKFLSDTCNLRYGRSFIQHYSRMGIKRDQYTLLSWKSFCMLPQFSQQALVPGVQTIKITKCSRRRSTIWQGCRIAPELRGFHFQFQSFLSFSRAAPASEDLG